VAEQLHTIPQTALRLEVSRGTVYELIRTGQLASLKIGTARRIPESSIEAFIRARMEAA
jgi:excisionase family DNA binding protein